MDEKIADRLYQELCDHLEFSIEHGGFAIGPHAQGGCSCPVCTHLRCVLMLKYFEETKKWPTN